VTNVFCAYAQKHLFDTIETIDIMDANAGDHGYKFATNFNPEIDIREITQRGRFWEKGEWKETDPLYRQVGLTITPWSARRTATCLDHEELESLATNIKGLKRIALLHDLLRELPHAPARARERRHDPHRPDRFPGPQDRADPVPQGAPPRPGLARPPHQG
jgi:hypothetical protein